MEEAVRLFLALSPEERTYIMMRMEQALSERDLAALAKNAAAQTCRADGKYP